MDVQEKVARIADIVFADELEPINPTAAEQVLATHAADKNHPKLSSDVLGGYAGRYYSSDLDVVYEIDAGDDDGLWLKIGSNEASGLEDVGDDIFCKESSLTLTFGRSDREKVTGFSFDTIRERNIRFNRL